MLGTRSSVFPCLTWRSSLSWCHLCPLTAARARARCGQVPRIQICHLCPMGPYICMLLVCVEKATFFHEKRTRIAWHGHATPNHNEDVRPRLSAQIILLPPLPLLATLQTAGAFLLPESVKGCAHHSFVMQSRPGGSERKTRRRPRRRCQRPNSSEMWAPRRCHCRGGNEVMTTPQG